MTPIHAPFRQELAQVLACDTMPFAPQVRARHNRLTVKGLDVILAFGTACYPFPSNWPGPNRVGPFFCLSKVGNAPQTAASTQMAPLRLGLWADEEEKYLQNPAIAVESCLIKTKLRGISCGKSLQLLFWSCHWQDVLTMTFSVDWWVPVRALLWQASRAATLALARLWAVCLEPFATMSTCAGHAINPAFGQQTYALKGPNGQIARLAFLFFGLRPSHIRA